MDTLTIRTVTIADTGTLLDLIRGLAEYEHLSHLVTATEATLKDALFGSRPGAEALLAFEHDDPIGFAVFFHNFSTFLGKRGLWLEDIFVKPGYRGKGYGRALFLHVARLAHERGCGRYEWAALDWNEPAIRFYKSMGAVALDDWTIFRVMGEPLAELAKSRET